MLQRKIMLLAVKCGDHQPVTLDPGSESNIDGFGDSQNTGLWSLVVFNNYLYAATAQWGPPKNK